MSTAQREHNAALKFFIHDCSPTWGRLQRHREARELRALADQIEVRDADMCEWDALQPDGQALFCHCPGCQPQEV